MHRRGFLQALAAAAVASPVVNAQAAGIRLGFDTYSLRAFKWKDMQLIDYAAGLKLDTIQISSLGDFSSLEPAHLQEVRQHAEKVGIKLDAGMGCICPASKSWNKNGAPVEQQIVKGLQVAKAIGADAMRCFMGSSDDRRTPEQLERCMETTIKVFRSVKSQAQDLGVKIALENHAGDMQAREVRTIIEEAGKDFTASCLDTGNPMWVAEDPMVTLDVLGPYVATTHVRDSIVFEVPNGAAAQWVTLGEGVIDFTAFFAKYRKVCPQAPVQLESITGRPPRLVPYLETDFWKNFSHMPASEFARFVDLAKHGHPYMGAMVIEDTPGKKPAQFTAALQEQQRVDLERGLEYAKKKLGLGLRG
jgi:sugar phosphate isomerase/epimerase